MIKAISVMVDYSINTDNKQTYKHKHETLGSTYRIIIEMTSLTIISLLD